MAQGITPFSMPLDQVAALLDRLPSIPFFAKDCSLQYIAVNAAMMRLCGRTRRQNLLGRTAGDVFPSYLARRYEALDLRVLTTGQALHDWLDLSRAADGRSIWLHFSRFPLYDNDSHICGVVAVGRELPMSIKRAEGYERLSRMAKALHKSPEQPLTLGFRAKMLGCSVSQLERDFRRVFGVSPREFHARVRFDLALTLLAQSTHITSIAHACGYHDHSAFSRHFKRATNMTPTQYANAAAMVRGRA